MAGQKLGLIRTNPNFSEHFEIEYPINAGSTGVVYRGHQKSTNQPVAIKVISLSDAKQVDVRDIVQEMRVCAELQHPHIVRLIDFVEASDQYIYLIFEFIPGSNLADQLSTAGPLPIGDAIALAGQMLDALGAAHARGIVHRDIKPGNVMVTRTGHRPNAHVLDFGMGMSRGASQQDAYTGTPAYSAPEQIRGDEVTPLSDIYSWGLTFLEMLTGQQAVTGNSVPEILHAQTSKQPVDLPDFLIEHPLGELILKVCAKDPERRSGDVRGLLAELHRSEAGLVTPDLNQFSPASVRSRDAEQPRNRIFEVPLLRNAHFSGRQDLIEELHERLIKENLLTIYALKGLGGIGKTQTALEYTYTYREHYDIICWIRAEEQETIAADFRQLARLLELPEAGKFDDKAVIEAVKDWMIKSSERWFIIFDNSPSPSAITPYIPRSNNGQVLITSRHQGWQGIAQSFELSVLSDEEAVDFLIQRTGTDDRESASKLAQTLGNLPLALEEAAAYIDSTGRSLSSYLSLFEKHHEKLLERSAPPVDYPATLKSAWEISFNQLEQEQPEATGLLNMLAYLAPDDLAISFFENNPWLEEQGVSFADELTLDECIGALKRYSLISVHDDVISIHRLVQTVTRDRLSPENRKEVLYQTLRMIESRYPETGLGGDIDPLSAQLLPHALVLTKHVDESDHDDEHFDIDAYCASLHDHAATYQSASGVNYDARDHLFKARELLEPSADRHQALMARICSDTGLVTLNLREFETAEACLQRAIDIYQSLGENVRAARCHTFLAWVFNSQGKWPEAVEVARHGVGMFIENKVPQGIIGCSAILAKSLYFNNNLDECRTTVERLEQVLTQYEGLYHPLVCGTFTQIGSVQFELGNTAGGLFRLLLALQIGESAYGHHSITGLTRIGLGHIHFAIGDYESAGDMFRQGVRDGLYSSLHMDQHLSIGLCMEARALIEQNQIIEAEEVVDAALENLKQVGGDRPYLQIFANLVFGVVKGRLGKRQAAMSHADTGSQILAQRFDADHPICIRAIAYLGDINLALGDIEVALDHYRKSLALASDLGLQDNPELSRIHEKLSQVYSALEDENNARKHFDQAVRILNQLSDDFDTTIRETSEIREMILSGERTVGSGEAPLQQTATLELGRSAVTMGEMKTFIDRRRDQLAASGSAIS